MATRLFITDERMLQLMAWSIDKGLAIHETDYLDKIKFPRQNISNVRNGHQSFTKEHIHNACELSGASADFIFGFTDKISRKSTKNAVELLKEAVIAVESNLKKNGR